MHWTVRNGRRKGLGWGPIVIAIKFGNYIININTREPLKVFKHQTETVKFI